MTKENEDKKTETPLSKSAVEGLVSHDLTLRGDLCQMGGQKGFLRRRGIETSQMDVYPVVGKDKVVQALSLIWAYSEPGWWHYKDEFVKYNICTSEQFKKRLHG